MTTAPTVIQAADVRPPSGASGATALQTLTGTAGTGAESTALTGGQMATIMVGGNAIRVRWGGSASVEAGTADLIIPAYGRFDWMVTAGIDDFVSVQAADATSAFEAFVWTSSGARSAS